MSNKNREKFVELANNRVNKAIKAINLVGNLSNKSNYSYTDEDARQIISALQNELKQVKEKFLGGGEKGSSGFQLKI